MFAGKEPFSLDSSGNLQLKFEPIIPSWLWSEEGTASFTFLGTVKVTYVNPSKADSWKVSATSATVTGVDGHTELDTDGVLDSVTAHRVRNGEVHSIKVFFN